MTDVNCTQLSAEAWVDSPPRPVLRDTQDSAEAWVRSDRQPTIRDTQDVAEVWARSDRQPTIRDTQDVGEAWVGSRPLGMTYPILPNLPGLSYSVFWSPEFANLPTQRAANKAEIDISLEDEPIHEFELTYEFLRNIVAYPEFKEMMGFFLRLKANAGRFLFPNPDDNRVLAQVVGDTDGSTQDFVLSRTFGVGDNVGTETVGYVDDTDLGTKPINVYFDGVLQSSGLYTIDKTYPKRQLLHFLVAPAPGDEITIDFSYFYYVKFVDENMSFEKFMNTLWSIKRVTIRSLRYKT